MTIPDLYINLTVIEIEIFYYCHNYYNLFHIGNYFLRAFSWQPWTRKKLTKIWFSFSGG